MPGKSLDDELTRLRTRTGFGYLFFTACIVVLAILEGYGYFFGLPRLPMLFAGLVAVAALITFIQVLRGRLKAAEVRLGHDGVRLEELGLTGASVFQDVPGDGFTLDHVVVCDRGVFIIETKNGPRPRRHAKITFSGEQFLIAGRKLRRDPIVQMRAQIRWLTNLLEQLTGEIFPVRGMLLFPGWRCEDTGGSIHRDVLVLEPKALPAFIHQEPVRLSAEQISRATIYLTNFIRRSLP